MDFWVLTVLKLRPKLEIICEKLDSRIESLALTHRGDTYKLYDAVMELNEKKALIVNIKVLFDAFISTLSSEEKLVILKYTKTNSYEDIAKELGINRSTVMRRINKAIKKCIKTAAGMGYTKKRFELDYKNSPIVYGERNYLIRSHLARSTGTSKARKAFFERQCKAAENLLYKKNDNGGAAYP